MGNRVIRIKEENCTGCRLCELACSSIKVNEFAPKQSRIKVIKNDLEGWARPSICVQCEEAMCLAVCPVGAIRRAKTKGGDHVIVVEPDACIGCYRCVVACPFGAIEFQKGQRAAKCDLCDGDPQCVRFCFYECLEFVKLGKKEYDNRTKAINSIYFKACRKIGVEELHKKRYSVSGDLAKIC